MKIIFLDIDGVMNSSRGQGPSFADMELDKLQRLKRLVDTAKADGIVFTSDRRYQNGYMQEFMEALERFQIPFLGCIRNPNDDDNDCRGMQIMDYLNQQEDDIESIVILDDSDEGISSYFPDEFIQVKRYFGFIEEAFNKALEVLNR